MSSKAEANAGQRGLFWAITYSAISIALTLFNKAVLSSYKFESSMTLTLLQGLVTLSVLEIMRMKGWVSYPPFNWRMVWRTSSLSIVFILYVVVSLIALGKVNVPMFTALRRLTIIFVMLEEYWMLGIVPSKAVMNSVIVMTIGAVIAAWKDLTFDPVSYTFLFFTNLFTSLYTVYINVVKKETGLNVFGLLFYNTVTTLPALAIVAFASGDLQAAWEFKGHGDLLFQLNFQASIWLAVVLNISAFYSTTLNTARTQSVIGQLKNFVAFALGLVLFNDYIYDHINFLGLVIGFVGGVQYSYVTYMEKETKTAPTPPPLLPTTSSTTSSSSSSSGLSGSGGGVDGVKAIGGGDYSQAGVTTSSANGGLNSGIALQAMNGHAGLGSSSASLSGHAGLSSSTGSLPLSSSSAVATNGGYMPASPHTSSAYSSGSGATSSSEPAYIGGSVPTFERADRGMLRGRMTSSSAVNMAGDAAANK